MSTALIIISNGEARGTQRNAALLTLTHALQKHPVLKQQQHNISLITCGVLSGAPSVATALQQAADQNVNHILIYPLFMSEGYFSKVVLPSQIAKSNISIPITTLPLLGSDPALPALLYQKAIDTLPIHWRIKETRLLIIGHGSTKNPASAQATRHQALSLQSSSQFSKLECAFLEEPPFIEEHLKQTKQCPTIIVGYFTGQGLHGKNDIEQAIETTNAKAVYAGSIGSAPEIKEIILKTILSHPSPHLS